MIVKVDNLRENLIILDQLFTQSKSKKRTYLYSKLALLELCGWIETTLDSIIHENAKKRALDPEDEKFIKDRVKTTYSFKYVKFRQLVILLIGIRKTFDLENSMLADFIRMKMKLNELCDKRNQLAHTHSSNSKKIIDSPQKIISDFNDLLRYFKQYEKKLNKIK